MDILTLPRSAATSSTGLSEHPRTLTNHFGGDATTDIADGIFNSPITYTGTWDLSFVECDTVIAFLRAHLGQTFIWSAPNDDKFFRQWQATTWTRQTVDPDHDQLAITFEERFFL